MPQMMPLNWLLLMLTFTLLFILLNIMNFYIFQNNIKFKNKKLNMKKINFNWKW